jgi:hypothetical protein
MAMTHDVERLAHIAGNAYWNALRVADGKEPEKKMFRVVPEALPRFRAVVEAILKETQT